MVDFLGLMGGRGSGVAGGGVASITTGSRKTYAKLNFVFIDVCLLFVATIALQWKEISAFGVTNGDFSHDSFVFKKNKDSVKTGYSKPHILPRLHYQDLDPNSVIQKFSRSGSTERKITFLGNQASVHSVDAKLDKLICGADWNKLISYSSSTGRVIATDSVIVATSGYVVPATYDISPGRVEEITQISLVRLIYGLRHMRK
ncbi:hypothetical protein Tco_1253808 [Tanacetum coccineum]